MKLFAQVAQLVSDGVWHTHTPPPGSGIPGFTSLPVFLSQQNTIFQSELQGNSNISLTVGLHSASVFCHRVNIRIHYRDQGVYTVRRPHDLMGLPLCVWPIASGRLKGSEVTQDCLMLVLLSAWRFSGGLLLLCCRAFV